MLTVKTWLGVAGWPVAHSRSPAMQNAALAASGLKDWRYLRLPLAPDVFAETVRALPARGFRGVNVTIPHKEAALALADVVSAEAGAIGAANTLTFEPDGAIHADNTDASGFLEALGADPRGRTALVLGAGGSARAVVYALARAGARVMVWNRTPKRAADVARELGVSVWDGSCVAEITVNCTSVGLSEGSAGVKGVPVRADTWGAGSYVVDMVYRDGDTALLAAARAAGAEPVDGLRVLIAQGAASFERWTGRPAPREAMQGAVAEIATT